MTAPSIHALGDRALASILRLDAEAGARASAWLSPLVLDVHVTTIDVHVTTVFSGDEIRIADAKEREQLTVDVELQGPPGALLRLALAPDDETLITTGEVRLHGDAAKLQALRRWLRSIDLDWEEWLATHFGDIVAHQMGNLVREVRRWAQHAHQDVTADISDYLVSEAEVAPPKWDVERWASAVDELRDDVARLEQRVERLRRAGS